MKRAQVQQRRTLGDGRRLVNMVCPHCDGRHWMAARPMGQCPRRGGAFQIVGAAAKCADRRR